MIDVILIIAISAVIMQSCGGSLPSVDAGPAVMSQRDVLLRAPSVFPSDAVSMHKYSAILAATEPFRQLCINQIRKSLNPVSRATKGLFGKSILTQGIEERAKNMPIDVALTRFEMRVQSIAGSYGMTVDEFNDMTNSLNKQPSLKKKVMLQSYFYKIAADLESNIKRVFTLPVLPAFDETSIDREKKYSYAVIGSSFDRREKDESRSLVPIDSSEVTRFATALVNIEAERLKLREKIKNALKIEELPPNIADPSRLPAFAEPIQEANKAFPKIASNIVDNCGFLLEEFNELRERVSKDPSFRDKVVDEIKKVENSVLSSNPSG